VSAQTTAFSPPKPAADVSGVAIPRKWMIAHLVSLALVGLVMVIAARGQWFFYDEWDFLAERAEWSLLAPHNGHLSFFPQLLTTLVKGAVGLHSYWPYLALTLLAHLAVVHMVWRLMMRLDDSPVIVLLVALVFGLLAAGTENTLWAFQIGFIAPLATGIAALLLAMRPSLPPWRLAGISVLLLAGVGFASTGLPIALAVMLFIAVRHGWRKALVVAASFALVYGTWYLLFARGTTGSDGFGAQTIGDVLVRMPEYVAHGLVDSLGKALPSAGLAPALVLLIVLGIILDVRRSGARALDASYFLAFAALVFAVLTAYTRVGLGVESASAGRYVYIYGALFAPLIGRLLSRLVGTSRAATAVVSVILLVLAGYNAGGTIVAGREQAAIEQTVNRTISAALTIDDGSAELAGRTPAAAVAPTLTMADVRAFVARGQYTPVPFTPTDLLDAQVNLLLTATPVDGATPDPRDCEPVVDGWVSIDPESQAVYAPTPGIVRVSAEEDGVQSFRAQIPITDAGMNELSGLDSSVDLRLGSDDAGGLCVVTTR